jgi:hypothetical protein
MVGVAGWRRGLKLLVGKGRKSGGSGDCRLSGLPVRGATPLATKFLDLGIETDGFFVVLDRTVEIAFVVSCNATIVEGLGVVGLETDGLTVQFDFFIGIGGVERSLKPFLGSQFFFSHRWSCSRCGLLVLRGAFGEGCGRMQYAVQCNIEPPVAHPLHAFVKVLGWDTESAVALERR